MPVGHYFTKCIMRSGLPLRYFISSNTGQNKKPSTPLHQPLLNPDQTPNDKNPSSTSKRKSTESLAVSLTKQRVTSHWLEKRANAFSSSEGSSTDCSSQNSTLSKAISSGAIKVPSSEPTKSKEPHDANNEQTMASGLVAYDDSD